MAMASRILCRASLLSLGLAKVGRGPRHVPSGHPGQQLGRLRCSAPSQNDFRGLTGSADDGVLPLFPSRTAEEAKDDKREERALALCLSLVSRRERTTHELRQRLVSPPPYLPRPRKNPSGEEGGGGSGGDGGGYARTRLKKRKGYSEEIAERVLKRLEAMGLLDDRRFAFAFAENRWRTRDWGGSRIRQELVKKHGIESSLADEAIDAAFSEPRHESLTFHSAAGDDGDFDEDEGDDDCEDGFEDEMERRDRLDAELYRVAEVQWDKPLNARSDLQSRKRRVSSYLAYRGHPFDRCARVVKMLERRDRDT